MTQTRLRSRPLLALPVAAATLGSLVLGGPAHADSVMTPDYEVKLLLSPSVLDAGHQPGAALTAALDLDLGSPTTLSYQCLDTDALTLHGDGWDVRERRKNSTGDLQLDYKRRWTIAGSTLTQSAVDSTLQTAKDDDFDSSDDNYDAEVDWGYSTAELSASNDKTEKSSTFSGVLPSGATAVDLAVDDVPGKLDDQVSPSGTDVLSDARVHGPVTSKQYEGTLNGHDVDVEVLPVVGASGSGTDYVVELSFKEDDFSTASSERSQAISTLDADGWLLHQDSLKTDLILDRY